MVSLMKIYYCLKLTVIVQKSKCDMRNCQTSESMLDFVIQNKIYAKPKKKTFKAEISCVKS